MKKHKPYWMYIEDVLVTLLVVLGSAFIVLSIAIFIGACDRQDYCKCHYEIWDNGVQTHDGTTILDQDCVEWIDTNRFGDQIQIRKYICE